MNVLMDSNISFESSPQSAGEPGLVPGVIGVGVDLAGAGVRTSLGVMGEVRGQTIALATQSIDLAEALVHGMCELGRRSAHRLDQSAAEALSAIERLAMSALGAVRATTDQAARLAMTVAEGAVGIRRGDGNKN
jgi:CheY-specific phosphatase CheX